MSKKVMTKFVLRALDPDQPDEEWFASYNDDYARLYWKKFDDIKYLKTYNRKQDAQTAWRQCYSLQRDAKRTFGKHVKVEVVEMDFIVVDTWQLEITEA